ncbi:unnamed protein product [Schistosoma mattheei]|uniref:Uncharacterized protein n=1 Tax=Schistosoma mattheei TaxID=31246 RepID=A0A183Q093_9TREM|nr:unnamed protein product [Schistosoma mattheei]
MATVFIDVPIGLLTGLCFSLLTVLYRTQSTYYYELGQIPNTNIYVDLKRYDEAIKLPNILILKYGGPLYYANSESFQNWIHQMTNINPHKLIKQRQRIKEQLDLTSIISKYGWWLAEESRTLVSSYLRFVSWMYLHLRVNVHSGTRTQYH